MRLLTLVAVSSSIRLVFCTCYRPNGTRTNFPGMSECPNSAMCCGLDREIPHGADHEDGTLDTRDECLPSGLCVNRYIDDTIPKATYWRNFCTDASWSNKTCLSVCMDENKDGAGNTQVTPCEDNNPFSEKWCCGDSKDCCTKDGGRNAIIIPPLLGHPTARPVLSALSSSTTSTSSSLSTTSTTFTTSSSPTSSATGATPTPTPSNSDYPDDYDPEDQEDPDHPNHHIHSTGVKAGIGIGAAAGALIFLGLGFFVAGRRWKKKGLRRSISPDADLRLMYQVTNSDYRNGNGAGGPVADGQDIDLEARSLDGSNKTTTVKEGGQQHV